MRFIKGRIDFDQGVSLEIFKGITKITKRYVNIKNRVTKKSCRRMIAMN